MVVIVLREVERSGNFLFGNQGLGIAEIPVWFPSIFCCGISLPPDQEGVVTRLPSVSEDHFNFIFFFTVY